MKKSYAKPLFPALVNDPKRVGALVRTARIQSALRQAEAAAMCGVGVRFLSDLENGKPTLQLGKTLQVLKSFGLVTMIKKKELKDE